MDFFCTVRDKEIINMYFIEGKKHYAFNLMVRNYSEKLYWQIRRIVIFHEDADDVLQETFIKVWNGLPKFQANSSLFTWMYRIATNEALNHLKKSKRISTTNTADLENQLKEDPFFDGDKVYVQFLKIVDALPDKQKLVFQLKYFEQYTYEDIADLVGGSVGSLKASYHHAVKKIERNIVKD